MWVRATRLGFYGHKRRKEGSVFEISDEKHTEADKKAEVAAAKKAGRKPKLLEVGALKAFSKFWMREVTDEELAEIKKAEAKAKSPKAVGLRPQPAARREVERPKAEPKAASAKKEAARDPEGSQQPTGQTEAI